MPKSLFKGKRGSQTLHQGPIFFFTMGTGHSMALKNHGRAGAWGSHSGGHPLTLQGPDRRPRALTLLLRGCRLSALDIPGLGQPHQACGHLLHRQLMDSPGNPPHHHGQARTKLRAPCHLPRAST